MDVTTIKARDLMREDPVCLDVATPIREAVRTLEEYRISGAPVTDEANELVGVLSVTDIVKTEHLKGDRIDAQQPGYYASDPLWDNDDSSPWGDNGPFSTEEYSPEVLGRETVGDWMTARVLCVAPDASVRDVASLMACERIHRVFVVQDNELVGVISTIDIVSYLARS